MTSSNKTQWIKWKLNVFVLLTESSESIFTWEKVWEMYPYESHELLYESCFSMWIPQDNLQYFNIGKCNLYSIFSYCAFVHNLLHTQTLVHKMVNKRWLNVAWKSLMLCHKNNRYYLSACLITSQHFTRTSLEAKTSQIC